MKSIKQRIEILEMKVGIVESSEVHFFGPGADFEREMAKNQFYSHSYFKDGEAFKRSIVTALKRSKTALKSGTKFNVVARTKKSANIKVFQDISFEEMQKVLKDFYYFHRADGNPELSLKKTQNSRIFELYY